MSWHKREKKQENPIECFTCGLGKTLIYYILCELLKGQRINHSFLRKPLERCHCKLMIHHLYATDSPIILIIYRMVFCALPVYNSPLVVHCMSSFLSVRPVDQQRRQLTVRFYSRCYIIRRGVGVLVRKIRLAMMVVVEP